MTAIDAPNGSKAIQQQVATELQRLEEDCLYSAKSHFNASDRWQRYHYLMGIPSIVLGALAGVNFFKGSGLAAVFIATVLPTLSALMTFLKPSERALAHRTSGNQFQGLQREARQFRKITLLDGLDNEKPIGFLGDFSTRLRDLNASSQPFANRDFKKARRGIEQGEADHQADICVAPTSN